MHSEATKGWRGSPIVDWDLFFDKEVDVWSGNAGCKSGGKGSSRLGLPYLRASQVSIEIPLGDIPFTVKQSCDSISSVVWDCGIAMANFLLESSAHHHGVVLDVGTGTGVAGMAALRLGAQSVMFTDNVFSSTLEENLQSFSSHNARFQQWDWSNGEEVLPTLLSSDFDTVLCSDVCYDHTFHSHLVKFLSRIRCGRIIFAYKPRHVAHEKSFFKSISLQFDLEWSADTGNSFGVFIFIGLPRQRACNAT